MVVRPLWRIVWTRPQRTGRRMAIWIFSTVGRYKPTLLNIVSDLVYFRTYKLGEEGVFLLWHVLSLELTSCSVNTFWKTATLSVPAFLKVMFLIHDKAVDLGISMRLKYGFLLEVRTSVLWFVYRVWQFVEIHGCSSRVSHRVSVRFETSNIVVLTHDFTHQRPYVGFCA